MFTGPEPAIRSILNGLLAVAAVLYAVGAIAIVIAVHADPMRARFYARLAGIVKAGPFLVGLACLGLMMDAVDLRSGHEADVVTRWPALLPQVAALAAGAAFLAGLLAGARAVRTALATGGPMAVLSALVWMAVAWFRVSLERERAGVLDELQRSAPDAVTSFILQGTAGAAFGASRMTSAAIIGVVGLVIIVLFAFLFLPQVGEMLRNFQQSRRSRKPCSITAILASWARGRCLPSFVYSCRCPSLERW